MRGRGARPGRSQGGSRTGGLLLLRYRQPLVKVGAELREAFPPAGGFPGVVQRRAAVRLGDLVPVVANPGNPVWVATAPVGPGGDVGDGGGGWNPHRGTGHPDGTHRPSRSSVTVA